MINFDLDKVFDMAAEYISQQEGKPSSRLVDDVEYLFERLGDMSRKGYTNGEVPRVVNSLSIVLHEADDYEEMRKSIRGIKSEDIAWIAAHFGFLYGMLYVLKYKGDFVEE